MSEEGLRFEPGKGCAYSNAGYYRLGLIIEKATGKSYEEVLGGQILGPLGMADAGCRSAFLEIGERLGPGVAARDKIKKSDVSLGRART